ncbi:MAG: hypothetical protein ACTHJS_15065 [Xanthobacteraceae bacterium]
MFHPIWRLSESGENNLGLACDEEGLTLGRTPLLERRDSRFVVRDAAAIQRLLSRAYRTQIDARPLMGGLATVAAALNANDLLLARIAAVHLRIPDLPDKASRDALEAEDRLIKTVRLRRNPNELHKASPDDPKHPGWPAGTEGGRGGQFRPKDGPPAVIDEEAKKRITRLAIRRGLRIVALLLARLASESALEIVPIVGEVMAMIEGIRTVVEFRQLKIDLEAAFQFIKDGPRTLEQLQVSSSGNEEFSSYDEFKKIDPSQYDLAKRFGPAGDGYQYHHIVTQGGANANNIPQERLHNTENIIRIPTLLHEAINAEYQSKVEDGSGRTVYEWLQTQSYEFQREYGLQILRKLHILK